jgi:hypothetical protein
MYRFRSAARIVLLASAAVLIVAGCGHSPDASTRLRPTSSPSSSTGPAHGTEAGSRDGSPRCESSSLAAHVVEFGSTASQPFLVISLTNEGTTGCHLRGYPAIAAIGHRAYTHETTRSLDIAVQHESIYERRDPGPRRVELDPNGNAFFALGTATAFDLPVYEITRLDITPPGSRIALRLRVTMPATGPANKPIPVGLTALQSGRPTP